jgi:hypothetical protein
MQSKRDIWEISGDTNRGTLSGVNMTNTAICKPVVLYRSAKHNMERFLTLDVYKVGDAPMHAIVYCPLCQTRDPNNDRNMSLRICETNKKIDLDLKALPKFPGISNQELVKHLGLGGLHDLRGRISIEPFGCTWEEEADVNKGGSMIGGGLISSCCNWRVVIENNIARDV